MKKRRLWVDTAIAAALFAGNLLILGPWVLLDYPAQPWNNGYIYMAIARMFRDRQWTWNPLQYAGAPFHYLYPPIFHVLVDATPVKSIGLAFHLITGLGYALVPVALYILCLQLFRARLLAAFAALAYSAFPSPAYLMPQWRAIAQPYAHAPWGYVTLIAYEEAAHTFALPFMLLAIAAAWRSRWLIASLLAAVVLLINWPALIGLGFGIAGLFVCRSRDLRPAKSAANVAGLAGVAYGLSAFWMTPGYFISSTLLNRIVLRHTLTAAPLSGISWLILIPAIFLLILAFLRRIPANVALPLAWVALSGAVIVCYTIAGNYLLPSPHRYMLEFNAGCILLITGLICKLPKWRPAVVLALVIVCTVPAMDFLRQSWSLQPHTTDPRPGIAWHIATWLNQHAYGTPRVFASGELDSTLPLWSDVPQVGGSGQDVSNFLIFAAERQIAFGCGADEERIAELWLRALNVRYAVVHNARSSEYFHWYTSPERFRSFPVAWDNGAGDVIYQLPAQPEAVVVDLSELSKLPRFTSTADSDFLQAYVNWSSGKRPAAIHWSNVDRATIDATLAPDEAVLIKINNDSGWRASGASVASDPIGFLLVRGASGHINLHFAGSWDQWLGRAISILAIILLVIRIEPLWIAACAVVPALAAYTVLLTQVPTTAVIAEEAFIRLQPPLINPGGIVINGRAASIYGLNFGTTRDSVQVLVDNRPAVVDYHGPNLIKLMLPVDAPPHPAITVEVNGCRGNEFTVNTQPSSNAILK